MRTMTVEQYYSPNLMKPMSAAIIFHALMFVWNPTVLKRGIESFKIPEMEVKMIDKMPELVPPVVKPEPPPPPKKKAPPKKKGLAQMKPKPAPVKPAPKVVPPPKPVFKSKIEMPKFTPRSSEDIAMASPTPGMVPNVQKRVSQQAVSAPLLSSKSRGIRAQDINMKLTERSGLAMPSAAVVVPIGAERSETVSLPSAPSLRQAPTGVRNTGYQFKPGAAELSDRNARVGLGGTVRAPTYQSGEMSGASGAGSKMVTGKGFEIGGPIGDRKIIKRVMPEYPAWAEEKGISATVQVFFTVKPDGSIRSTLRIQRSSGYSELDDLAKQAILQWRFSPASVSDESVAWGIITFKFTIQ